MRKRISKEEYMEIINKEFEKLLNELVEKKHLCILDKNKTLSVVYEIETTLLNRDFNRAGSLMRLAYE